MTKMMNPRLSVAGVVDDDDDDDDDDVVAAAAVVVIVDVFSSVLIDMMFSFD